MKPLSYAEVLVSMVTSQGISIEAMSNESPLLLVFLRHLGCVFCREAMKDISRLRRIIERKGVRICLVHMSPVDEAERYFTEFGLDGIDHISDPGTIYYKAFGLVRGNFNQIFGLQVWLRTAEIAFEDRQLLSTKKLGDGFQMPGVFLLEAGEIKGSFIHRKASDRPDYELLINQCDIRRV